MSLVEWMERHGVTQEAFEQCPLWVQVCVWVLVAEIALLMFWSAAKALW